MTHVTVPLDSYRLAQYAYEHPCYICAGGNNFDAQFCRHCQAPMALAEQLRTQQLRPRMVAVLGSAGVGKTVYLGVLSDMLSRQKAGLQILARGAYSINLQQNTMSALARCAFPPKTPSEPDRWNWLHCQVRMQKRRPVELIVPDIAGDALLVEVDRPKSYPVIESFLRKCAGALILVDTDRVEQGEQEQDFFIMKIMSYLQSLGGESKRGWSQRPVAVLMTKADVCDSCSHSPRKYAQEHIPGSYQMAQQQFQKHDYFAVSVAGACAVQQQYGLRTQVPLRIEPRGIVEPFTWLMENLPK